MNVLRQHMRRAFTRVHPFTAVTKANRGLSTASRLSKAYLNTLLHRRQGLCGRWVAAQLFTKEESGKDIIHSQFPEALNQHEEERSS